MPIAAAPSAMPRVLRARSLRLWSGCLLGLFLLCHFINIAFGLISVGAMDAAAPMLTRPWHGVVGSILLGGALAVHFGLSLRALYRRRTLRMAPREAAQLALGLALPFLISAHVVAVRIEPGLTGVATTYAEQVRALWVTVPANGIRQAAALLVAWTHGCFGLWFWLRTRAWFQRWTWALYALVLLVPILALLGFAEAGREMARLADVPAPAPVEPISQETLRSALVLALAAAVAAVLAARALRQWRGRHRRIRIHYPEGRIVTVGAGFSVLEASRIGQIPHVAMCGGRGRCSTCRVRVLGGGEHLPPPAPQEHATLARSGAAPDTRLACQLRPTRDVAVMPVFAPPRPRAAGTPAPRMASASHERELAVLFCDLRGFTRRAEQWLPFDTVFLLNRYFEMVGEAVEEAGGYLDKFIGDGALALFGLAVPPEVACRQALTAAAAIARGLDALNVQMAKELGEPLHVAMGLHTGPAIVGDMGYGKAIGLTAVGDGINVASRLEGEAKERGVEAVVSAAVLTRAGRDIGLHRIHNIAVRGRVAPVEAVFVLHAALLAEAATNGATPAMSDRRRPQAAPTGGG